MKRFWLVAVLLLLCFCSQGLCQAPSFTAMNIDPIAPLDASVPTDGHIYIGTWAGCEASVSVAGDKVYFEVVKYHIPNTEKTNVAMNDSLEIEFGESSQQTITSDDGLWDFTHLDEGDYDVYWGYGYVVWQGLNDIDSDGWFEIHDHFDVYIDCDSGEKAIRWYTDKEVELLNRAVQRKQQSVRSGAAFAAAKKEGDVPRMVELLRAAVID